MILLQLYRYITNCQPPLFVINLFSFSSKNSISFQHRLFIHENREIQPTLSFFNNCFPNYFLQKLTVISRIIDCIISILHFPFSGNFHFCSDGPDSSHRNPTGLDCRYIFTPYAKSRCPPYLLFYHFKLTFSSIAHIFPVFSISNIFWITPNAAIPHTIRGIYSQNCVWLTAAETAANSLFYSWMCACKSRISGESPCRSRKQRDCCNVSDPFPLPNGSHRPTMGTKTGTADKTAVPVNGFWITSQSDWPACSWPQWSCEPHRAALPGSWQSSHWPWHWQWRSRHPDLRPWWPCRASCR